MTKKILVHFAFFVITYLIALSFQRFDSEPLPYLLYVFGLRPKMFLLLLSIDLLYISFLLSRFKTYSIKVCTNVVLIFFSLSLSFCICEFFLDRQSMRIHLMPQRIASIESKYVEEGIGFRFQPKKQVIHATLPDASIPWFAVDPNVHQSEQSNVDIHLDQNGFRNTDVGLPYDLVVLGDSFVLSAEQPDGSTWIDIAFNSLGLKAYNMGTGGFGVSQSIQTYLRYGDQVKHWGLVLCINGINDLVDEENYLEFLDSNMTVKEWAYRLVGQTYPIKTFMVHHYLRALTTQIQFRKIGFLEKPPIDLPPIQTCIGSQCKSVAYYPLYFKAAYSVREIKKQIPKPLQTMQHSVNELQAYCQKNKIKLVVLYFPAKFTIHSPVSFNEKGWVECLNYYLNEDPNTISENSNQISEEIINADLLISDEWKKFCESQSIPFRSLIEDLRNYSKNNQEFLYYSYDIHWNKQGNICVGQSISDWFKQ